MTDQQIEAQINELISSKIAAADNVDSGLLVAAIMALAMPVLRDIAATLKSIDKGIAPDDIRYSVAAELRAIFNVLAALERKMEEPRQ